MDDTVIVELCRKANYTKELVYAVKYLMDKGFSTREISRRLDVSPVTVQKVKRIIRKAEERKKAEKPAEKPKSKPKPSREEFIKALRKVMEERKKRKQLKD